MQIRPEKSDDKPVIAALITAAFRVARRASGNESAIVDGLRRDGALAVSLVAVEHARIVGHVAFSPVEVGDTVIGGWFGLGPLAVHPQHHGHGIGSALAREGLNQLREAGAAGCVVLGDPEFYARLGFVADPELAFPGVDPHNFQRIVFSGAAPRGSVRYNAAFYANDGL